MTPTWNDLDGSALALREGGGAAEAGADRDGGQGRARRALPANQRDRAPGHFTDATDSFTDAVPREDAGAAPGGARAVGCPRRLLDAARHADGDGRARAAHRLRERGQPAADAGDDAAEGDGGAAGARRAARASDPADADREASCSPAPAGWSGCCCRSGSATCCFDAAVRLPVRVPVDHARPARAGSSRWRIALVTAVGLRSGAGAAERRRRAEQDDEGSRCGHRRRHPSGAVRKGLVVAQVALSMLLVAGGGLFARSLYNLQHLNRGFDSGGLVSFSVEPSLSGYDQARIRQFADRLLADVRALPGVTSASLAEVAALTNNASQTHHRGPGIHAAARENMNAWPTRWRPTTSARCACRCWPDASSPSATSPARRWSPS